MIITYDTATQAFAFDEATVRPAGANIEARIARHGRTVPLAGLQFGITITHNDGSQQTHVFPPSGVTYVQTDQDKLTSVPVRWSTGDEVTVEVWLTTDAGTVTAQHSLTVPRPPQPYPSWTWDGSRWAAPVAYPEDGGLYQWDEAAQTWAAIEAP
jgi:hypothetical protein